MDHPYFEKAYNYVLKDFLVNFLVDILSDWGIKPERVNRMQKEINKLLSHQDEENGQFLSYIEAYDRKTKTKYPM